MNSKYVKGFVCGLVAATVMGFSDLQNKEISSFIAKLILIPSGVVALQAFMDKRKAT